VLIIIVKKGGPKIYARFWILIAVQAACAQTILWSGLPIYRKLMVGKKDTATLGEMTAVIIAVVLMQFAYWAAHKIQPRLSIPRNVLIGHGLLCLGELSFLFPATIAAVAFFDDSIELNNDWWRVLILVCSLFAMYCYKHQLETLGHCLLGDEREADERH
jgi:ABC-type uncharacterized transport system permease subunit